MVALAGIAVALTYSLYQLETAKSAPEEARDYAERNGETYPFDLGGDE
jgi:hypothetical protein